MDTVNTYIAIWLGMTIVMTLLYLIHLKKRDAGLVDMGWTAGVGVAAVLLACLSEGWVPRRILVAGLAGTWAFRLFYHLLKDRVLGKEEDARYRALRDHWGKHANRNFFWVFQLQSLLVLVFSLPLLAVLQNTSAQFHFWELAGVVIWLIAVSGESLADHQLAVFRADTANKGKVCMSGLWRYSRHPNYFFEWLHWCSYVVMGLSSPWFWLTLAGPLFMWLFLWNITGIPFTEKRALASRGDAYRAYQRTTNAFFPWIPKKL